MSRDDDRDRGRSRDRDDDRGRSRDRDDDRGSRRSRDDDDRGSRGRDRDRDDDRGSSRGGGRDYTYRARSAESVAERASMGGQDYDKLLKPGTKMFKPHDGDNRIRILPPTWTDANHYGLDVFVHYGVGPDRASYICPRKHGGKPCPVCEERDEVRGDSNSDEKYVKELEAKRRVLVYLVDREAEREGEQAWFMPWTLDKDITIISRDKDTGEVLTLDHHEDGYDVMFEKSGAKDRTKYEGVQIARRPSPLGKRAWLESAMDHPLPDQLQIFDYDTIAKAFGAKGQQRDSRERDDDDRRRDDRGRDDDRPSRTRDDDRGRGRERDDERDRDSRRGSERDDGRDRDSERDRGRTRERDDEPTWKSVHAMTRTELEDLIELKRLPIKPREAKDDDDLANWVCEEMKLKEDEGGGRRRASVDDEPPARDRDRDDDRLREMRKRRED